MDEYIIKFRGWHTHLRQMFSAEELASDQLTLLTTGQFINVSGSDRRLSRIMPADKFIPLQFTNRHDENGKEVYQGDLLRNHSEQFPYVYEVYWSPMFQWSERFNKGQFAGSLSNCVDIVPQELKYYVVGNIYENPELIEK